MSRALLALALGFALGGGLPLQWAYSLVLLSATSDYGSHFDPDGSQSNPDYGGHFDPNGSQSNSDYGGHFDPNG